MKLERQIEDLQAMHASQWFEKLKEGRPEDVAAFRRWCGESPVHIREFLEITSIDRVLDQLDASREEDLEALVRAIQPAVRPWTGYAPLSHVPQHKDRFGKVWYLACAAALTLFALCLYWYKSPLPKGHEYSTQIGELRTVELTDASAVTLNTDSDIKITFQSDARDIELRRGEAVFKVASDPNRPFRVHTRAGVIQAIGTRFNVYDRPEGIDVVVLEGRVRLMPHSADRRSHVTPEDLVAGEGARIGNDGLLQLTKHADIARVLAWSKSRLKFDNTPLEEIVSEFNRYQQSVRLRLEGVPPDSHTYTGIFDADDPAALARVLEQEPDLSVIHGDREIVIRPRREERTADHR